MEINFWRFLDSDDDSKLRLRLRAPDVCVFRGCHLEAWFHSNQQGLFTRRTRNVSISSALETFLAVARGHEGRDVNSQSPVAILRRPGNSKRGCGVDDVPHTAVITVQELKDEFQRAENGVEDEEAECWTVQTLVQPNDNVRWISIYHCDACGQERSDIFGKSYSKLYSWKHDDILPGYEEIASDSCIAISDSQREIIEAKTQSIVRFTDRFHELEFDGLVLEFVFDNRGHAVLQGCWNAAVVPAEMRGRFRSNSITAKDQQQPVPAAPRSFPAPNIANSKAASAEGTQKPAGGANATTDEEKVNGVLLEIWRGEEFLGEAPLPSGSGEHRLRLRTAGPDGQKHSRPDRRKQPGTSGSVLVSVEWTRAPQDGRPMLNFAVRRADGLIPPSGPSQPQPRALLWLQQSKSSFAPLWASREATARGEAYSKDPAEEHLSASSAVWNEVVELCTDAPPPQPPKPQESEAASNQKSAGGYCHSSAYSSRKAGPQATEDTRSTAFTTPGHSQSVSGSKASPEQTAVLKSPRDVVAGAEWISHWGTCEKDGSLRGSILASMVTQRLGTERINRSLLLSHIAGHIDRFADLQRVGEEQLVEAKATLAKQSEEAEGKRQEAERIRAEIAQLVKEQETRLAKACREMCGALDELRIKERLDEVALEQSKERINEQRTMVHQLVDKSHTLQGSLDRTVRKFDEVSSSYAQVQGELMRSQVVRPPQKVIDTMGQAKEIREELTGEQKGLEMLKGTVARLNEEIANEQELSLRLEDFVRRVAEAPPAKLRTGGGYQLDCTAKSEAAALLGEIKRKQA